jgi:hypothetical protein
MKLFMITYMLDDNKPTSKGILPSEFVDAIDEDDAYIKFYKILKLTKEQFNEKHKITEIKEIQRP